MTLESILCFLLSSSQLNSGSIPFGLNSCSGSLSCLLSKHSNPWYTLQWLPVVHRVKSKGILMANETSVIWPVTTALLSPTTSLYNYPHTHNSWEYPPNLHSFLGLFPNSAYTLSLSCRMNSSLAIPATSNSVFSHLGCQCPQCIY